MIMWGSLITALGIGSVAIYGAFRVVDYAMNEFTKLEVVEGIKEAGRKVQKAGQEAGQALKDQSKMSSRQRSGEMTAQEKKEAPIRKATEAAQAVGLALGSKSSRSLTAEEKKAVESIPGAIGVIGSDGVIVRRE